MDKNDLKVQNKKILKANRRDNMQFNTKEIRLTIGKKC